MFAPINSQYQVQHNHASSQPKKLSRKKLQTHLSLAVGIILGGMTVQVNAANNSQIVYKELPVTDAAVNAEMEDTSQMVYERLKSSNVPVKDKEYVAKQTELFFECREVQTSAARLACYDKVVEQGKTPGFTMSKKPLDLAKTFRTTINGNPQVILAEEDAAIDDSNAQIVQNEPAEEAANERLDTLWLTEREAQVLEDAGVSQTDIEKYTALSLAYDLDQNSERGTWTLRPHNPNYILPLFYSFDPNLTPSSSRVGEAGREYTSNEMRNTELKFQISLKAKVAEDLFDTRSDLWFGYTQQSHWQVYNEDNSRPFRATDYQPEIFLTQPVTANLPFGGRLRMLGVGAVHHSNGQSDPISRSWNRAYLIGGAEWGKLTVIPRIWTRINNESKNTDDNPDITDYMGHGDLTLLYDLPNQQSISSTLRYNTKTNKGAAQIDYVYPLTKNVNGFVQLFQGYGESIIDYNHENTAIGVGIVLNDWKGF
ncbi:phospholipase A [Psychrobacter jeotgali]|uniref:phospholipase A n=1 Tax=Psychrobacter jeotgali TaxID=179010 RepID=UPI00191AF2F5|nr:phospholipase A [Psychrobacter jeotgali]